MDEDESSTNRADQAVVWLTIVSLVSFGLLFPPLLYALVPIGILVAAGVLRREARAYRAANSKSRRALWIFIGWVIGGFMAAAAIVASVDTYGISLLFTVAYAWFVRRTWWVLDYFE